MAETSSSVMPDAQTVGRKPLPVAADVCLLLAGYAAYLVGGRTPRVSYHAMRRLYGPTNGLWNRWVLELLRKTRPALPIQPVDGFLGHLGVSEINAIVGEIERHGYAPLCRLVPSALCDDLLQFARNTPCRAMKASVSELYPEAEADSLRYDYSESSILTSASACRMIFDGTLASIAEAYFKCRPIYDFCAMWWTTGRGERAYSEAAQKFHFDMDRPFFLKFFVYLTDVDHANGPHVFVSGSHRTKPRQLRDPRRFEDPEVESCYAPESILQICGPRGTIFAVDTCGIHKGMPVVAGHRLAFQIEFTVSMFGQTYPKSAVSRETLTAAGISKLPDQSTFRNVLP